MMLKPTDLTKWLPNQDLNHAVDLQLVLEQINKDFALQGIQIIASTQEPEDFIGELVEVLNEFINADFEALSSLLYRIDIPESAVQAALSNQTITSEKVLLRLIVEREYQKVLMRKKWSG